ncbi:DUF4302 domain-containing protein [Chitinophaga japonensis]|uniref:Uncharacterized protein DUF4302 n=1 Tax=Chitinophaga japonensis TaxID=104662 RepID=A0A562T0E4_CHIJA|nr:DUF4302 domain-containing protein [Chitinophaga japonensis]TWI86556.1 uncharacterized protein DUF4302 [Chitinophaga japonensis]
MMNRTLLYTLAVLLLLLGCSKEDDPVFDQTPDERINETLAQYQAALSGAANGWNARVVTGTGGIFNFHFRFNAANRVTMYADIDTITAGTARESSYRLKALQQPSLIFDTYSYLHMLADPDGSVNGGNDGEGLQSDFEFAIDSVTADSILLTGRFNGTRVTLYRSSDADAAAWQNGNWRNALAFQYIGYIPEYFKRLALGSSSYDIRINQQRRTITFMWLDAGNNLRSFTTSYYFSSEGMVLVNPFTDGNRTITSLSSEGWDAANAMLRVRTNGGTAGTISGAIAPARPDREAPARWWQFAASQDSYWISFNGFRVNGVDDAFHVRDLPAFAFLVFWPAFGTQSGVTYDLLGFVFVEGSSLTIGYGAAWRPPVFTADGRVLFQLYGTLGTVPPGAAAAFNNTNALMSDPDGFYLVQTGELTYDMVSAKDARSWITWEY